jgi:hypothetical protein
MAYPVLLGSDAETTAALFDVEAEVGIAKGFIGGSSLLEDEVNGAVEYREKLMSVCSVEVLELYRMLTVLFGVESETLIWQAPG